MPNISFNRRLLRTTGLLVLPLLLLSEPAAASGAVVGESCTGLGVSQLADNQKDLVACLKDDSNALVWKSMTTTNDQLKLSTFSISGTQNTVKNIGSHKFCALQTEGESSGCGRCMVYQLGASFMLDSASCNASAYTWCGAVCFD
jgi:hypothetical protein